jgi:hypothetical protein
MKIAVERKEVDGILQFIITCYEPEQVEFGSEEIAILTYLDKAKAEIETLCLKDNDLRQDVFSSIHNTKERCFHEIKKQLDFEIRNSLKPKFEYICNDIYNWIYDYQKSPVKIWMQEFDPQRTKYYFDNDRTIEDDYDEE